MSLNHLGPLEKLWTRLLHVVFWASRGLTLGVRAVVTSEDGRILLVRHTYTAGWHFPGGGVEKNETAESALARELEQETGLKLIGVPELHGIYFNRSVNARDHVLVYLCETHGEVLAKPHSLEIAETKFFDLEQLPHDIDLGTRRRLEELTKQKQPAQEW